MHDVIESTVIIFTKLIPSSANNFHHRIEVDVLLAVLFEVIIMLSFCVLQIPPAKREKVVFVGFLDHKVPMIDMVGIGFLLDSVVKLFDVYDFHD